MSRFAWLLLVGALGVAACTSPSGAPNNDLSATPRNQIDVTAPRATPATPKATSQPAEVYFKNCTAARAAGAAPVHRGDPGYRSALDRDGDGVGCE